MMTAQPVTSPQEGASAQEEIAWRDAIIARLEQENRLLREKVDLLVRKVFGRSSEALDERQLMLLLQGEEDAAKKTRPPAQAPAPWRLSWQKAAGS